MILCLFPYTMLFDEGGWIAKTLLIGLIAKQLGQVYLLCFTCCTIIAALSLCSLLVSSRAAW